MAVDVASWVLSIDGGLAVAEVSLVPEPVVTGAKVGGAEEDGAEEDGTEVELGTVATTNASPKVNNLDGVLQQVVLSWKQQK